MRGPEVPALQVRLGDQAVLAVEFLERELDPVRFAVFKLSQLKRSKEACCLAVRFWAFLLQTQRLPFKTG